MGGFTAPVALSVTGTPWTSLVFSWVTAPPVQHGLSVCYWSGSCPHPSLSGTGATVSPFRRTNAGVVICAGYRSLQIRGIATKTPL